MVQMIRELLMPSLREPFKASSLRWLKSSFFTIETAFLLLKRTNARLLLMPTWWIYKPLFKQFDNHYEKKKQIPVNFVVSCFKLF